MEVALSDKTWENKFGKPSPVIKMNRYWLKAKAEVITKQFTGYFDIDQLTLIPHLVMTLENKH